MPTTSPKVTKKIKKIRGKRSVGDHIYLDDIKSLTPLGQTVILKDTGGFKEEVTEGGLIIPTRSANPVQVGKVVSTTEGWFEKGKTYERFFPTPLKKGDKVLFFYFGANKLRTKKGNYLLSKLSDIVGIIDGVTKKSQGN